MRTLPIAFLVVAATLSACMGEVGELPEVPFPVDSSMPDAALPAPEENPDAGTPVELPVDSGLPMTEMDAGTPTPPVDAGTPPAVDAGTGLVPAFIAQGAMGRTTMSCNGGRSWVANRSWEVEGDALMCGAPQPTCTCFTGACNYRQNDLTCGSEATACIDTPDVPKGIAFGNGKWVATWGWGMPGAIRSSTNGVQWTTTHDHDSFGALVFGGGHFVAASRFPLTSSDGASWATTAGADFRNSDGSQMWSVRRMGYVDVLGGRFVAVASGNSNRDVMLSADQGQTWRRPTSLPADCAHIGPEYGGILSGNGVIVMVDAEGRACRSTDGGDTWTVHATGATEVLSQGVWTGTEFRFWGNRKDLLRSTDGMTWTKEPMTTPYDLGPVAFDPNSGTYVASVNVWRGYAQQKFYRSTDGLSWTVLPSTAFVASHPIFHIAFGYVAPSADCPAP